jgi:hypothetical protein
LNVKTSTAIALAATILAVGPALAAQEGKNDARAHREASCRAQAAKKYSAIHLIRRHNFVNECMGVTTTAKKARPSTSGQRAR